jgi:hypothetical protein
MLKFNTCPNCNKKITFEIELDDIDTNHFPAPIYISCKFCNHLSTFYMDSRLQVSYKELGTKKSKVNAKIKTIKTF